MNEHWSDVLGNEESAAEVVATATIETQQPEPNALAIAEWMEQQSRELHGDDHRDRDWMALARQLMREAAREGRSISGTAPNTSIVLTPDELAFCEANGGKSATIHEALRRMMAGPDGADLAAHWLNK